jgi:putative glutamine transport system substrate-binding protein
MNETSGLRWWIVAASVLVTCVGWLAPPPLAAADSVQTIKERGFLRAGVKYDSPPYGWLNPATSKPEGFDVDIARLLAAHILGAADKVQFTQVTTANRIPLLQQGDIDVVLATMTITAERRKQIDFSIPYFPSGDGVLVSATSSMAKPEDLKGKTVCFTSGSASEQFLVEALKPYGFPIARKILLNTYPECVQAIKVGRADYLFTDFGTLQGLAKEIAGVKVLPFLMDTQDWGIGVSKARPELLEVVNAAIKETFASGRWLETYKKWQGGDPPAGWPPKK